MKNKRQQGKELENHVANKLIEIGDNKARPTRASGASTEIGDIFSKWFFVEAKQKHSKNNVIMDYKKEYIKLLKKLPINTQKELFIIIENKMNEKFIVIEAEAFFRIVKKAYGGNNEN